MHELFNFQIDSYLDLHSAYQVAQTTLPVMYHFPFQSNVVVSNSSHRHIIPSYHPILSLILSSRTLPSLPNPTHLRNGELSEPACVPQLWIFPLKWFIQTPI